LKLSYGKLPSKFPFSFNLRHYSVGWPTVDMIWCTLLAMEAGLALVHFPVQTEPFLTPNTP